MVLSATSHPNSTSIQLDKMVFVQLPRGKSVGVIKLNDILNCKADYFAAIKPNLDNPKTGLAFPAYPVSELKNLVEELTIKGQYTPDRLFVDFRHTPDSDTERESLPAISLVDNKIQPLVEDDIEAGSVAKYDMTSLPDSITILKALPVAIQA